MPVAAAPIRILVFGDSITQGGFGLASYRDPLIRILNGENVNGSNPTNRSYSVQFVGSMSATVGSTPDPQNSAYPNSLALQPNHEGHSGWRADEILNGATSPLTGSGSGQLSGWLQGYDADVVLLHIGTNDSIQNDDNPDPQFANTTWNEIATIVQQLQAESPAPTQIFVARIIPIFPWGTPYAIATQGYIDSLNNRIGSSAPGLGTTVVEFTGFNAVSMMADSWHPNASGEAHMAAAWFTAMKPTLDALSSPAITSSASASVAVGASFSYTITASNDPTSFGASGLPPGLSVNSSTGLISGVPTTAGIYGATISATNSYGTGEDNLVITVSNSPATVTLSNLSHTYDGTPKSAAASTSPAGLNVVFTYDGGSTPPTNAGSYSVVATVDDQNYTGSATGTLTIAKAAQVIDFAALADKTLGDPAFALNATASSGLPVAFSLVSGPISLFDNTVTLVGAGGATVRASQSGNGNYLAAVSVDRSFNIAKGTATVTLSNLAHGYDGTPKSATVTTNPAGLGFTITYNGSATAPVNAGSYAVVATVNDANYQGSASGTLGISPAAQTINFPAIPDQTFGGGQVPVSATATSGLPVSFAVISGPATLSGNAITLTGAGTVTVRASQGGSANIAPAPNVDRSFTVAKATATVTLSNLGQTYDGTPRSAAATTVPADLSVTITYDGSATAPTNAGSYAAQAVISDANYVGSTTGTLVIAPAAQTITFATPADKTFGDAPFVLEAGASSGLPVSFAVVSGPATVSGSTVTLTSAGSVIVRASQSGNSNYAAATAVERAFTVAKGVATVSLQNLVQAFDGAAKPASAVTVPAGLGVAITYDGAASAPAAAGSYAVVATINDTNYAGSANGTLTVAKAAQTITFPAVANHVFGDAPFALSATASSGLAVSFSVVNGPATVSGNNITLTGAGAVTVRASQAGNGNYTAAANVDRSFTVAQASATISLSNLSQTYDGSAKSVSAATQPGSLTVNFTYNGSSTPPTNAGTYAVVATINDASYSGSVSGNLVVNKAAATITLGNLIHAFDGTPKAVTATTNPVGRTVTITYDGNPTPPSQTGTYAVVATVDDPNFSGTATASMVIATGSHLVNLASRSFVGAGSDIMIPGFVIGGTGTMKLLIRGIGPELLTYGVSNVLEHPTLMLYSGSDLLVTNTGWSTAANAGDIALAAAAVGAFPLPDNSADCAMLVILPAGDYTVHLTGNDGETGAGLVEIYDVQESNSTARLVNIATRAQVGTGGNILIPGYVIEGEVPRKVLVRAVGPTLGSSFGVAGVLEDPTLTIFRGSEQIATNDDWGANANLSELISTTTNIGAFDLVSGSRDAAILITLPPGGYTVQISGNGGTQGLVIAEIYEVP